MEPVNVSGNTKRNSRILKEGGGGGGQIFIKLT